MHGYQGQRRSLFGSIGGSHPLARLTDQQETYGPLVVEQLVRGLNDLELVVDLGAGSGRDLEIVRRFHPKAKLVAVEAGREYADSLAGKADQIYVANIEHDLLPLADASTDLIIANQVLEHTKEIFWIFHEVSRSLKVGGHFYLAFRIFARSITAFCY
jgi:SAM-dependent methyltransferase